MNKLYPKIGVSEIDPKLSWMEAIHYWQEYVEICFTNMLQFGVVTLYLTITRFEV